jgi:acetyltransferase
MDKIFSPKSIAIIGASAKIGSIGNTVVQNLIDSKFEGKIFPINPTAPEICGIKAYSDITKVPDEEIDLAVYTVPAKFVVNCARQAATKKVKGHIVITSGFSEVGNTAEEEELVKIAHESGGRVLGPNIVGLLLNSCNANASFAPSLPYRGHTALVSQSGALLIALDGTTFIRNFGCSSMVSLGNMSDVDFADTINYYAQDPDTNCVTLYVEGLKNGRAFIEAGRKSGKPVIALKSGVSARGAAAAASHTGSLAGAVKIYDAAFNQAKVIRAMDLDEMLDCSQALSMQPPMRGENTLVITNGGGIGVLSSDAAEVHGIPLSAAPQDLQDALYKCMPSFGSPKNPVDITGGAGAKGYEDCIEIALKHDWVDAIAVLYCETATTKPSEIADAIRNGIAKAPEKKKDKPLVACFVGGIECQKAGVKLANECSVPLYDNPKKALCALSALRKVAIFQARKGDEFVPFADTKDSKAKAMEIIEAARKDGRNCLTEPEAKKLFGVYGLPVARTELARTEEEALKLAHEIGFPVVMKIVSPDILHKSDAGGVKVNIKDDEGVKAAFKTIIENAKKYKADANIHGICIQEMAPLGKEVIVGSVNDATFGPTVMYGMGGIFVEVLKDVTFRVAPFSVATANEMLPEIKSFPILKGTRGEKPCDVKSLAEVMSRASQLVWDLKDEVSETDANPVMLYEEGKGLKVVDARIILKKKN